MNAWIGIPENFVEVDKQLFDEYLASIQYERVLYNDCEWYHLVRGNYTIPIGIQKQMQCFLSRTVLTD